MIICISQDRLVCATVTNIPWYLSSLSLGSFILASKGHSRYSCPPRQFSSKGKCQDSGCVYYIAILMSYMAFLQGCSNRRGEDIESSHLLSMCQLRVVTWHSHLLPMAQNKSREPNLAARESGKCVLGKSRMNWDSVIIYHLSPPHCRMILLSISFRNRRCHILTKIFFANILHGLHCAMHFTCIISFKSHCSGGGDDYFLQVTSEALAVGTLGFKLRSTRPSICRFLTESWGPQTHPLRLRVSGIVIQTGHRTSGLNCFPVFVHAYNSYEVIK